MEVLFASVPVADLAGALSWYEKVFDRAPDIVPDETEAMWRVSGDGWLYVKHDAERAGRAVVTISVSDLDEFVSGLAARGVRTGPVEFVGDAGRKAVAVDLEGNVINLIEVGTG